MAKNKGKKISIKAVSEEKGRKKVVPVRKLATVVALFALSTALYYAFASAGHGIVYPIYVTVAAVLIVTYFIMNKGVVGNPDRDSLSDGMTEEEKDDFLRQIKENKRRSEPVLYVFLAITLTVLCDTVYAQLADTFIGDMLSKMMEAVKK